MSASPHPILYPLKRVTIVILSLVLDHLLSTILLIEQAIVVNVETSLANVDGYARMCAHMSNIHDF